MNDTHSKTRKAAASEKAANKDAANKKAAKHQFKVLDSGAQSPALDRALALLEFISVRAEGVTAADIRGALGFSTNLVFRLTKALVAHGYVERDVSGSRFVLSTKLLTLAQPKREERSLAQLAWEPMRWLRDVTGESAHVGVRSGFECIVLDRVIGPHPFKCYVEAGAHGPLHAGAPGKVMLAWMPAKEQEDTLNQMPLIKLTANTITSKTALSRHLSEVKRKGYAMDLGEGLEGHHCLGAPVFDVAGRVFASVWITATAPRLTKANGARLAPFVIEAAQRITDALR